MTTFYTKSFYQVQANGSQRSANVVVPMIVELFDVKSVIDIGCGVGTWLRAFDDAGIHDYIGLDGDYVDPAQLQICRSRFASADLREDVLLDREFDLACSLEVAEHLPAASADAFVRLLTKAAPRVLFSAAVPGQGGNNHINEQWQSYWAERFAAHGFLAFDCVRPNIYGHPEVEWWYQQNILMFCRPESAPANFTAASDPYTIDRIHPQLIKNWEHAPHSGRQAVTAIGRGLRVLAKKSSHHLGLRRPKLHAGAAGGMLKPTARLN